MEWFAREKPEFRAAEIGRRNEAGGCYFCVLPCGLMAVVGLVCVAGLTYGVVHWVHVIAR